MKKVFLLVLGFCLLVPTSFAGLWTTIQGARLKEVKPTKTYAVDVIGQNIRVYEFDTQEKPAHHCVIVFTESDYKAPVMQCWEKK